MLHRPIEIATQSGLLLLIPRKQDVVLQPTNNGQTMKNFLLGLLGSTVIALSAFAALEAGDTAPIFEAKASLAGEPFDFSFRDALDDGPVVVYFYPSAYTQG